MPMSDIQLVLQWWAALFLVGVAAFPLTKRLFQGWFDRGYLFAKAVGMAVVTYIVFLLGTLYIAPCTIQTVVGVCIGVFGLGVCFQICNLKFEIFNKNFKLKILNFRKGEWKDIGLFMVEEVAFFAALFMWSWVKAHEPSIRGLEKFMDFGFMQTLLNSQYFPAPDMWWAGGTINYYFFGHLVTAVLTRLSGLDLAVTFNLMLATLCALTLTMSFSIGYQLSVVSRQSSDRLKAETCLAGGRGGKLKAIIAGLLTSFLVTFAGNMQTIYAFTKGYVGENVVPFWTILWSPVEFFSKIGEGMTRYWYANATRFIPFTIHEFPSYSFVVSDIHGHVLSLPFVLLAIAIIIQLFNYELPASPACFAESRRAGRRIMDYGKNQFAIRYPLLTNYIFYGFLMAVLLMTNALSGPIYVGLFVCLCIAVLACYGRWNWATIEPYGIAIGVILSVMAVAALPFLLHFSSFAAGIGVNCPLACLQDTMIGPFLFEGADKCQKSPFWMLSLLWGFFWYCGIWLFVPKIWGKEQYDAPVNRILKVFFIYSLVLITIPEFFYVKDIYPAHFRSNTMFKLGYEAFIMWSIVAGYVIVHFLFRRDWIEIKEKIYNFQFPRLRRGFGGQAIFNKNFKLQISNHKEKIRKIFFLLLIPQLFLVSIYPVFSVKSYFGELKTYRGIYGLSWLESEYPSDYEAILWLRNQIHNSQFTIHNVSIVEADGDSYTDYNHISAFAGVPTIVGWAVHEWLWRGSYDVVAPRREDVRLIYESGDPSVILPIIKRYHVRYIIIGKLEREKFKGLREDTLASIGKVAFQSGDTVIYIVK